MLTKYLSTHAPPTLDTLMMTEDGQDFSREEGYSLVKLRHHSFCPLSTLSTPPTDFFFHSSVSDYRSLCNRAQAAQSSSPIPLHSLPCPSIPIGCLHITSQTGPRTVQIFSREEDDTPQVVYGQECPRFSDFDGERTTD